MKHQTKIMSLVVSLCICLLTLFSFTSFSQVKLNWVNQVSGPGNDEVTKMFSDESGNVYLFGNLTGKTDFDPSADTLNLQIGGYFSFYMAKYSSSGSLIWAKSIEGLDSVSGVGCSDVKFFGNHIYILGGYEGTVDFSTGIFTDTIGKYIVIKYDTSGNFISKIDIMEPSTQILWFPKLEIDKSKNLIVTGSLSGKMDFDVSSDTAFLNCPLGYDLIFAKYDSSGNYQWAKQVGDTFYERPYDLKTDSSSNIYIVGFFYGNVDFDPSLSGTAPLSSNNNDGFIAKYDNLGNYIWAFNIQDSGMGDIKNLCIDPIGDIYLAGSVTGSPVDMDPSPLVANLTLERSGFIAKYTSNGNYQWAKAIGYSGTALVANLFLSEDLYLMDNGDLLLTGTFEDTADFDPSSNTFNEYGGDGDFFAARYDSVGNFKNVLSSEDNGDDYGTHIALGLNDNILVSGYFESTVDFDPSSGTASYTAFGVPYQYDVFLASYCFSPYPANYINGQSTVCQEQINVPYYVNFIKDADTYVWNYTGTGVTINGADSLVYLDFSNTATSGILTVYGTNICSDGIVSDSFAITVMPLTAPSASITVNGQTEFCYGDSTILQANVSAPGLSFQWFNDGSELLNDTFPTLKVFGSGVYTVQVTAPNGCPQIPLPVTITVHPLPSPIISQSNDTLFSNYLSGNQWYMNGNILSGEVGSFLEVSNSGNYSVLVTDINTCSDTSAVFLYIGVNENPKSALVKIYPNPTTGLFSIEYKTSNESKSLLRVIDIYGREVYRTLLYQTKQVIDLSNLSTGVYTLNIASQTATTNQRVVIQR